MHQAPVPLTIFRSNSKFDQNLECFSLKYSQPITTKFCTRHDSYTVVPCAKFRRDWAPGWHSSLTCSDGKSCVVNLHIGSDCPFGANGKPDSGVVVLFGSGYCIHFSGLKEWFLNNQIGVQVLGTRKHYRWNQTPSPTLWWTWNH